MALKGGGRIGTAHWHHLLCWHRCRDRLLCGVGVLAGPCEGCSCGDCRAHFTPFAGEIRDGEILWGEPGQQEGEVETLPLSCRSGLQEMAQTSQLVVAAWLCPPRSVRVGRSGSRRRSSSSVTSSIRRAQTREGIRIGRAAGFGTEQVTFDFAFRADLPARMTPLARSWRTLASLCQKAVALTARLQEVGAAWAELNEVRRGIKAIQLLADELPSCMQMSLAAAVEATTGILPLTALFCARVQESRRRQPERPGRRQLRGPGNGGAAHAFSWGPCRGAVDPLVGGLPAAGQGIVDAFLAEWVPMWSDATRLAESTAILERPVRATLEPITLQQLDVSCSPTPARPAWALIASTRGLSAY